MDTILYYSNLFDLYKGLLTDKQCDTFKDYFFENLTLDEIALNNGTSKNAVSKTIKTIKSLLEEYENNLHFYEYTNSLKSEFSKDTDILKRIEKYDNIIW